MLSSQYRPERDSYCLPGHNYYAHSAPPHPVSLTPALAGEVSVDACVIGAGFTGLAAAHFLAKSGVKVAVLERHEVGWGASGRNGGQLLPGYLADIRAIYKKFGRDNGRAFWDLSLRGMNIVKEIIRDYKIDCDWKTGVATTAETKAEQKDLEQLSAFLDKETGFRYEAWNSSVAAERLGTTAYCFGLYDGNAGHLHPLKYIRGFARALLAAGTPIYAHSPAEMITRQNGAYILNTPGGVVKAKNVVLCGDSYLGNLIPQLRQKYVLIHNAIIATEPLPESFGVLPCAAAVAENSDCLHFYRKSADNRLLFGGGDAVVPARNTHATQARAVASLKTGMTRIFPQLKGVPISFEWGGDVAMTSSYMPNVGMLEPGMYFANGFSGHGIGLTHICGKLLADAITRGDGAYKIFSLVKNISFPGNGQWDYYWTVLGMWLHQLRHKLTSVMT